MKQKIKIICLALALLVFAQPAHAGFFDWLIAQVNNVMFSASISGLSPKSVENEIILQEVPQEAPNEIVKEVIIEKPVVKEVIKEVPVIKEVIKEVPVEVEKVVYRSTDQQDVMIKTLEDEIRGLKATIISLQNRILQEQSNITIKEVIKEVPVEKIVYQEAECPTCPICQSCSSCDCPVCDNSGDSTEEVEYSDLQVTLENIPTEINLGNKGAASLQLLGLKYLGGRDIEVKRISFTTNGNPQFYDLHMYAYVGDSDGLGFPVFGNNGLYYWEGSEVIKQAFSLTVKLQKRSCIEELNNCDCEPMVLNMDLSDWIIWDKSTNKQIKLEGVQTITGNYSDGCLE